MLDESRITLAQIDAMRSEALAGSFPTPELMRADGTLIVSLPYSLNPLATAYDFRAITPEGKILPDSVYSRRAKDFVKTPVHA